MQCLLLAAGYGTRLLPYTRHLPKPLFPVLGKPLIVHTIETMRALGVRDFWVNLHHLPERIPEALGDGSRLGVTVRYSREPEILGTGGAIRKLRGELGSGGDFWVVNSDMLFSLDLAGALERHRRNGALATLVLFDTPDFARYGGAKTQADGRISAFLLKGDPALQRERVPIFTGVQIVSPELLRLFPDQDAFCIVRQVYQPQLGTGKIFGHASQGTWQDIGTPEQYLKANLDLVPPGAKPEAVGTIVPPVFAGPGCRFGAGCEVGPRVVLGEKCRVGAGVRVRESVLWAGVRVPAGAVVDGRIVTGQPGDPES